MTTGMLKAPVMPTFGAGAPTVKTFRGAPYFNRSTNPYTAYIWRNNQWNSYGAFPSDDVTQLQGFDIVNATPLVGQVLTWKTAGGPHWIGA